MSRAWPIAVLIAIAFAGVMFTRQWVSRPWQCDSEMERLGAATLSAESAPTQHEVSARARRNIDALRPLIERCPLVPNLYMMLAVNEQLIGRDDDAARTYARLLEIEQRPEIYNAQGDVLVRLGRYDDAVDAYVKAGRFAPDRANILHSETRRRVRERLRNAE